MKEKVKKMGLNIKSHKEFDKEVCVEYVVFVLVAKEVVEKIIQINHLKGKESVERVSRCLSFWATWCFTSFVCDIQHAINLVTSATLPNFPYYRMNHNEHVKL